MIRAAALLLLAAACSEPVPRVLAEGEDTCAHCHMTLAEARFGAELVTRTGRVYAFDDAGCLASFVAGGTVPADRIHSLWVSDFTRPDSLLAVERAVFVRHPALRTPMNYGVVAVSSGAAADSLLAALGDGGRRTDWDEILAAARRQRAP